MRLEEMGEKTPTRVLDGRNAGGDLHRPQYHFLPPANWMNDPNGIIQWQGELHMFYQYNPASPLHEQIHWGHATSRDLVHWRDLPIALSPSAAEHDGGGCWSGTTVEDAGTPMIFYTGVFPQTVCRASSADGLLTWQKDPGNPVIAGAPPAFANLNGGDFRDPFVWREGDEWQMIIGTRTPQGGVILLYRSYDLRAWQFVGPYLEGDRHSQALPWSGTMWECPNLLRFDYRSLLIISPQSAPNELLEPVWHAGIAGETAFTSERQGVLVFGHTFYAPQVVRLSDERTIMWGWLKEARDPQASVAAGWSGVMSVPIEVTLDVKGAPHLAPVRELETLRRNHRTLRHIEPALTPTLLEGITGDTLDLTLDLLLAPGAELALILRCTSDLREYTLLRIGGAEPRITVEHIGESLHAYAPHTSRWAPLAPVERHRLRILLDRSTLEIFAEEGRTVLATRLYPLRVDALGVGLYRTGRVRVEALDVWEMASIW